MFSLTMSTRCMGTNLRQILVAAETVSGLTKRCYHLIMENDSTSQNKYYWSLKLRHWLKNWAANIKIKWLYMNLHIFFSKMHNI